MLWEKTFPKGHGRGALTNDGIFVPSGVDKVIKFRSSDGEQQDEVKVLLAEGQPVGNLFSDGKGLYSLGLRQVCLLGEVEIEPKPKPDPEKEQGANKEN